MNIEVNFVAVLLAGIVSMVAGFVYYSPAVLGKPWMKYMKYSADELKKEQKQMGKFYGISFVLSLVTAYVLYHVMVMSMNYFGNPGVTTGLMTAFWSWLGFVMPVQFWLSEMRVIVKVSFSIYSLKVSSLTKRKLLTLLVSIFPQCPQLPWPRHCHFL